MQIRCRSGIMRSSEVVFSTLRAGECGKEVQPMFKRILSLLLALSLCATMLPLNAIAEEAESEAHTHTEETTAPTEETTAPTEETGISEETGEAPAEEFTVEMGSWYFPNGAFDAEQAFLQYARQEFYGPSKMNPMGTAAGATLTGEAKLIYNALVPHLKDISDGKRSAAVISVGQTVGGIEPDGKVNLTKGMDSETYNHLIDALLMDLSYELYWINVTKGFFYVNRSSGSSYQVEFYFSVDTTYNNGVTVDIVSSPFYAYADTAKTGLAASAAANAKNVVAQFAGKNDYNKLLGYAQWISDQVTYDYDAVNNDAYTYDINPWQLIHAFDGDPNTNIVCEGYAKAFHYLCDLSAFQADTECYKVTGTLDGGGHMWNHVRMNGKYYLVDVTCYDQDGFYWDGMFMAGAPINEDGSYTIEEIPYAFYPETQALWGSTGVLDLAEESYDPSQECPGHVWNEGTVTYPPTCYYPGQMEYSCTICHITRTEEIPMADHDHTIVPRQEPTCTRPGYAESDECSMCGLVHSGGEEIPALGHSNELRNAKEPTCTEEGYTGDTFCIRCGSATGFGKSIPALGHDGVLTGAFDPTCTEEGYTGNHVCTRCGEITQTGESIPALGHNGVHSGEVAPSCEEPGNTGDYICSRCGAVTQEGSEIPALGHEGHWVESREPDCEQEGHTGREECVRCGKVLSEGEVIPALGHGPELVGVSEPACEKPGYTGDYVCKRCGEVTERGSEIAPLGHDSALSGAAEPTCEEPGYTGDYVCKRCGEVTEQGSQIAPLGHDCCLSGEFDPTCTEPGYTGDYVCSRCDRVVDTGEEIPPLGHDGVLTGDYAPTCEEPGYTGDHICSRCGEVTQEGSEIPALGHDPHWMDPREPDCEQEGHTGREECARCGAVLGEGEVVPALGHTAALTTVPARAATDTQYGNEEFETWACSRCGAYVHEDGRPMSGKEFEELRLRYKTYAKAKSVVVTLENGEPIPASVNRADYPQGLTLKAQVLPFTAKQEVTWTSGAKTVATVNENGTVTFLKNGSVTITAAAGSVRGRTSLKVVTWAAQITITGKADFLIPGKSLTLKAQVLPADTTNKKVIWSLSGPGAEVATITSAGTVKIPSKADLSQGPLELTVTATAQDGSEVYGTYSLILYPKVTSVTLTNFGQTIAPGSTLVLPMGAEDSIDLAAFVNPENALNSLTWKSSSTKTLQVDQQGKLTALKPGTVTITVTANDGSAKKATVKIKVVQLMEQLEIPDTLNLAGGKNVTFKPVIGPKNTTNKTLVYSLMNAPEGVTITKSGTLKTKPVTEPVTFAVYVEATDGSGAMDCCDVTLYPAATSVSLTDRLGNEITEKTIVLPVGQNLQLGSIVGPEKACDAVTWKTSSAKTATVSENGLVTPIKPGTITLTVTAADGTNRKDTVKIKVIQLMESLTIPGQLHLAGGKSYTFKPVIGPANTTTKGINWTLEAPVTGVTLSTSGVLRTKSVTEPVTVTVVATAKDGSGTTARCAVTIYPAATKVTLTQNGQPITVRTLTVVAGQQLDLDAIVSPEGAYEGVTWKSSSPTRASVDENGVVTALKTGSVTITATAADGSAKKATIIIKVLPA